LSARDETKTIPALSGAQSQNVRAFLIGVSAPAGAEKLFNFPILNPARKAQAR
jgi:hypothetical protein